VIAMSKAKTIDIAGFTGEIIEEKYNPLIKRREVVVKITHIGKSTPSRAAIKHSLAKYYNVSIEQVIVREINTEYGIGLSKAIVHVYDSVERAKMFEPEYILKRDERSMQSYQAQASTQS